MSNKWNIATYSLMPGTNNVHDISLAREWTRQLKNRGFVPVRKQSRNQSSK